MPEPDNFPIPLKELQHALRNLYDPGELSKSSLLFYLGIRPGDEALAGVRRRLTEAVQSLKPEARLSQNSKAWRIYNVLQLRFIEQFTQKQVASDMGLGIRQLRRLEIQALQTLTEVLLIRKGVSLQVTASPKDKPSEAVTVIKDIPNTEQELEWLQKSTPSEATDIVQLVEYTIKTVRPLLKSMGVNVAFTPRAGILPFYGQLTTARQGLLNVLTSALQAVPGGEISLILEQNASEVVIRVYARPAEGESLPDDVRIYEMLKVARRLVELSGGRLDVTWNRGGLPVLNIHVGLPVAGEWVVLVLDDNLDVLRLVERYLTGSRYRLVGLQDPRRLMETVAEARPDIIVLDVMLPEVDGWDLLGRLREHPVFGEIPIVVSTILPQETLAMALGAKVFLPKPVSQEAFLKTLDKIVADLGKAPR